MTSPGVGESSHHWDDTSGFFNAGESGHAAGGMGSLNANSTFHLDGSRKGLVSKGCDSERHAVHVKQIACAKEGM